MALAVFDGEKFDAREGKPIGKKRTAQTMWGWLAWQIDPERAFPIVEGHDRDRVAPGGDVIEKLLTEGANGRPVLILLDEVLKYMERAAAVSVHDSTLQRQAKDFFQSLTVEVANSKNAVLVYSLTWSASETLGNVALLREIDHLAQRVDQMREPVSGEEVLPVIQRRLLGGPPPAESASAAAGEYAAAVVGLRRAYAETTAEKRQAEKDGEALRPAASRLSLPSGPYRRDARALEFARRFPAHSRRLRFLATCLHPLKKKGGAAPVLAPGDVPLHDAAVRRKLISELGLQGDYDAVILADIDGPNARARQIDETLAQETPALANVRPATRLATAILLYSFGGLRRDGDGDGETLPPGVTETELLGACVAPSLDNITAAGVLAQLRTRCLYLHFDGVRYCFKKDPNVNKLVEEAEQAVAREEVDAKDDGPVRGRIKAMLEERLAKHPATTVWPADSTGIPDNDPRFVVAYLPLEFTTEGKAEQEARGLELLSRYGDRPRNYRNAVSLAVPDKKQVEAIRRAARYLIAVERVEAKKAQHRLTKEQLDELKERRRTEAAAAESSLRDLYTAVWLLRIDKGAAGQGGAPVSLERVEKGGRPLQTTGIHERVMELLTTQGAPKVHSTVTPGKIIERLKLGESLGPGEPPRLGVKTSEIRDAFFCVLEPPRLLSGSAIRAGIARGVTEGTLAYTSGAAPTLGPDGKFQVSRDKVAVGHIIAEDEIDLDSGFVMLPEAVPAGAATPGTVGGQQGTGTPATTVTGGAGGTAPPASTVQGKRVVVELVFDATRDQLYKTFSALANLAEKSDSGKVTIRVEARSAAGFDPAWLRNAVEEPLDEADVERK